MKMIGKFKQTDEAFYFETNSFPDELGKPPKEFNANKFIARLPVEICKRQILKMRQLSFFLKEKQILLKILFLKEENLLKQNYF